MNREYVKWISPALSRPMEMLVYGHEGTPLLVFPTSLGRFYQYEDFGMITALRRQLDKGMNQVFCVDSLDGETWYNYDASPGECAARHAQYERYIIAEVMPFIRSRNSTTFTIVTGCSFGAFHAANFLFRYPQHFHKVIAISGKYELRSMIDGRYDPATAYFYSPLDYLSNLTDPYYLEQYRRRQNIFVCGDAGDICYQDTLNMANVLDTIAIPHTLDIWSNVIHDWPGWRQMIAKWIV